MIMARRGVIGLLAGLAWSGRALAAAPSFPRSIDAAARLRRRLDVPALAAGWRETAAVSGVVCAGRRMVGSDVAVTPADSWHWGSITKPVTATLIALAVEAGELAWDEALVERLGLREAEAAPWRGVSLLHLLSHTSGFARLDADAEMDAFPAEEADPRASRLALTRMTLARTPQAAPGAQFIYSNRNYVAAAAMLEAACRAVGSAVAAAPARPAWHGWRRLWRAWHAGATRPAGGPCLVAGRTWHTASAGRAADGQPRRGRARRAAACADGGHAGVSGCTPHPRHHAAQ